MTQDKTGGIGGKAFILAAVFSQLLGTGVHAQQIELKAVTAWPQTNPLTSTFFVWEELVEERLGDQIKITYMGGPEVVAAGQQAEALSNGVVDIAFTTPAYYATDVPEAIILSQTNVPSETLRANGGMEYMQQVHEQKGGVHILGSYWPFATAIYLSKEKVESSADLKGLDIRTSGPSQVFYEAMGANPINIPYSDMFTALERGVIDGLSSSEVMTDTSIRTLLKYKLLPTYYRINVGMLIGKSRWDEMPEDLQQALIEIGVEAEAAIMEDMRQIIDQIEEESKAEGMEAIELSDGDAFLKKAYEAVWEFNREKFSEAAPELEAMFRQ